MRWQNVCMMVVLLSTIAFPSFAEDEAAFHVEFSATETDSPAFQVEILTEDEAVEGPRMRVLIYHTHTYEAYEQVEEDRYQATEQWRTKDEAHNVVAVGAALAGSLRASGVEVVHDRTAFEPPNLDDAYSRSLAMLEQRISNGETYDLYIDLHRDALASNASISKTVKIGDIEVARFMVLVGQGKTGGYTQLPDWEANLAVANRITEHLNQQQQNLARNVKIKSGRFNQHISDCCVLIECGMNTNTLEEVLAGIPYLSDAIVKALSE